MGRPPTRTPLHRDPNPNLFVQLAGKKTIRLMKPEVGRFLYESVRQKVHGAGGDANMRGEEMMQGGEMEGLENAVWDKDVKGDVAAATGVETTLRSGDALYIPYGWWHAVRGVGHGVTRR
jgi:ribosomal protein L16 Arg81 hydroxylase